MKVAHLRQFVTLDKKIVVAQFARNLPETAPLQVAQFVQNHWLTLVQNGWLTLVQIIHAGEVELGRKVEDDAV